MIIDYDTMILMGKLKKILALTDPYPSLQYEIFCYLKAALGTLFFVLGVFLIFHPLLISINFFNILLTGLSPAGLKLLSLFNTLIWPKGYWGFLLWGTMALLWAFWFFWQIKLVKKVFGKEVKYGRSSSQKRRSVRTV